MRMRAHEITQIVQTRKLNDEHHGLNGISLHSLGFELFKKVLLVALGIWVSKKISNDQELIQSDPTSCPQNQKGNN